MDANTTPIERELEADTLRSEKMRTTLLAAIFFCFGTLFAVRTVILPASYVENAASGQGMRLYGPLLLFGYAVYALIARQIYGFALSRKKSLPVWGRYVNAFVEISAPTAMIWLIAGSLGHPAEALNSPPAFAYFLFVTLAALRLDARLCLFTGAVAAVQFALTSYAIFARDFASASQHAGQFSFQVGKTAILFASGLVTAFVSHEIRKRQLHALSVQQERNRIENIFGQHVSPAVVDALLRQKEQSEYRHVCVLFLDIRNFTAFSENRSPAEVVDYLNRIFEICIEIINRNNGIINKFLGDGFMAVFGAPLSDGGDVRNAVEAARQIVRRIDEEVTAGRLPPTGVGMGLHAGEAVTGNVGSESRKEYTVIGDVVNLASRIEQLNKQYATRVLVSDEVVRLCADLSAEFIAETQVKGREQPVKVYRLA
ncbi:MAG: adenylate/guanylate cyclase domain-containing protein [Turneriella sp.]